MSWQAINDMLGRAMIDERFARLLLTDPPLAAREGGFNLTPEESEVLQRVKINDIAELSQVLLTELRNYEQQGLSSEG